MIPAAQVPRSAALYCRISRDAEKLGLGVARQQKECGEWAGAHGWVIGEVYVDNDVSAFSGKARPSYGRMIAAVASGERDGILAWHNDRLHRSPKELEPFIDLVNERNIPVGTVTGGSYDLTTSAGRLSARIVGAVARSESEHKSERAKSKHRELAESGRSAGGVRPFGLTKGRTGLVEEEAELIRQAARDLLAGRSTRAILAEWRQQGIKTSVGGDWPSVTFIRMMTSDWVNGRRGNVEATWPAILDDITHRRVVSLFDNRRTGTAWSKHLLSGIAICGLCGSTLVSRPRGDKTPCYVCASVPGGGGGCGKIRVVAESIEQDLLDRLWAALGPARLSDNPSVPEVISDDTEALRAVQEAEALATTLAGMLGSGDLSPAEFVVAKRRNDRDLAEAQSRLADSSVEDAAIALVADAHDLETRWAEMDIEERRRQLAALTTSITVGPAVRGRNRYDASRVSVVWRF